MPPTTVQPEPTSMTTRNTTTSTTATTQTTTTTQTTATTPTTATTSMTSSTSKTTSTTSTTSSPTSHQSYSATADPPPWTSDPSPVYPPTYEAPVITITVTPTSDPGGGSPVQTLSPMTSMYTTQVVSTLPNGIISTATISGTAIIVPPTISGGPNSGNHIPIPGIAVGSGSVGSLLAFIGIYMLFRCTGCRPKRGINVSFGE